MGECLKCLFNSDFMPHGACWRWEPWVVWPNVISDAVIFLCYVTIALTLIDVARRRRDVAFNWVVVLFGVFTFACGCTHAMEVYNAWHGVFRLAGVIKGVTAAASLLTTLFLLHIAPKLRVAPTLNKSLAMDAALSCERQEKHRVEGELRETRDRYRLLVEGIKDYAIFMLDPEGRITSWNSGAERITGYTAKEALGQPFSRLFPKEEVAAGRPEQILRAAKAQGRVEQEGWRIRKGGSRFLVHEVITAFYGAQGILKGYAKIARDITEQRATQAALQDLADSLEDQVKAQLQELRESEARLQGFIRHSPAAISFKGLDGRFLLINPKAEAMFGRPAREILGKTLEELFPEDIWVRILEQEQQVIQLRQDLQAETRWVRRDGAAFDLLADKFPLVDATGQCWGLGILATDITERKQADLALLQGQKLESLGVLAGGIAHDFNNLLGAMQGNVELALAETSLERAQPYLETMKGLMAKGSGLLRQMLAYAGQGKPSARTLNLNHLVSEMVHLLGSSISKKARIRLDLHPQLPPMEADPAQIQQVVMNLVINASEAMGEQPGVITLSTRPVELNQITIDTSYEGQPVRPGPHVGLEVADDGCGMPPEVLKRIFDPFFTTKFTGRGLGLAAIHGIVRGHQGGIRVTSEPGIGSSFKLLFPAARGQAAPVAPDPPLPRRADGPWGTVLVVDDEDEMRSVVVRALGRAGFQVLQARDGLEALSLHQEHRDRIRLIIMDLTMPNMDGEEACRELRRRGAAVPVVLCSGFNETEALRRFDGLDLAGFLQKPFGLGALVERVRNLLADNPAP
jgi:PAS domain S-box-containing protein